MFVNNDYFNWYKCFLVMESGEYMNMRTRARMLFLSEENRYLSEFLEEDGADYCVMRNISIEVIEKFSYIFVLEDTSGPETDLLCEARKNNQRVIDIFSRYKEYESGKISSNYIVDEFKEISSDSYDQYVTKKELLARKYIEKYIENRYVDNKIKLFNKVEIETINRCNNNCAFCPVSRGNDKRPPEIMDKELFKHIINQLRDLNYSGALALFSNNEPLLDERLPEFAAYARRLLPDAFIYTNAKLLEISYLKQILPCFDNIHINNYNLNRQLNNNIRLIHEYLIKSDISESKVSIHLRNSEEIMSSRGGNAPNKSDFFRLSSMCILPFSQLIIRPSGKVSLCCNDAYGSMTLGSLAAESIADVWEGKEMAFVRSEMRRGRMSITPCNRCDTLFTPLPFERI